MNTCGGCIHWQPEEPPGWRFGVALKKLPGEGRDAFLDREAKVESRYRLCTKITLLDKTDPLEPEDVPIAITQDSSDYEANLWVRDDFGCVLWEAKGA